MGQRLTFRERGREHFQAADGDAGYATQEQRFRFVPKSSSDVGDGTAFPLLVTLDQLMEIMCRVKDAWFTAGAMDGYVGGTIKVFGAPDAPLVYYEDNGLGTYYQYARGYFTRSEYGAVPTCYNGFFGTAYTVNSFDYCDAIQEPAMFCDLTDFKLGGVPSIWIGSISPNFQCGFSHLVESYGNSTTDLPSAYTVAEELAGPDYEYAMLSVIFSGDVAYLGDDPLAADAVLYVGVLFEVYAYSTIQASTRNDVTTYTSDFNFKLELADGVTVGCPIYTTGSSVSGSDFILTAQEWWPYATRAGVDAWGIYTGLPVNGGPAA